MKKLLLFLFIILCLFSFLSKNTHSGAANTPLIPDIKSFQLYYFWDLRNRETLIQVFNTSNSLVNIHVQVFNVNNSCVEFDFFDQLTLKDAHIYNMRNIEPNQGPPLSPPPPALDKGYGFVVITVIDSPGGTSIFTQDIIGNFRIVDNAGYEYRSNAAPYPSVPFGVIPGVISEDAFNFSDASFSDLIGIAVADAGSGISHVGGGGVLPSSVSLSPFIFDEHENFSSCSNVTFSCSATNFEKGINSSIPSSKGASSVCPFISINKGILLLEAFSASPDLDFFVVFIGLNNGSNLGSMQAFSFIQ